MSVESNTMSNAIKSPAVKEVVNVDVDAKAKAEALQAKVNAEVVAFSNACQSARKIGSELGFQALLVLASAMGESGSKVGRPSSETYHAFTTALTGRKLSYEQRAELARKANASVKEGHKPLAVITGKATHDRGSQTYRFNVPALTSEQLG
jgi:hypothetical protein